MTRYPNRKIGINGSLSPYDKGESMVRNRGERLLRYEGVTFIRYVQVDLKTKINSYFLPVKKTLQGMRLGAVTFFLVGLFSFAIFVGTNLWKENHNSETPHADSRTLIFGKDSLKVNSTDTILILKRK